MKDRFVVGTNEIGEIIVTDVQTDRVYRYNNPSNFFGLIRLLNEQQATITELKSIINFVSDEGDLIVLLMKEIIKLRQEVQECRAYETIEKGVSNYD